LRTLIILDLRLFNVQKVEAETITVSLNNNKLGYLGVEFFKIAN